jgi:hypothetical protein
MRSAAAISQTKEYASQERATGIRELLLPLLGLPVPPDLQQQLISAITGQALEKGQFQATATIAENGQANQIASPDALGPSN